MYFSGEEEGGIYQGLTFLESAPNALSKEYDCSCKSSAKRKRLFKFFSKYYITKSYKLFQTFLPLYSQQNYICIYSKRLSEINTFKLSKYEYAFKKIYLACRINDNFIFSLYVDHWFASFCYFFWCQRSASPDNLNFYIFRRLKTTS